MNIKNLVIAVFCAAIFSSFYASDVFKYAQAESSKINTSDPKPVSNSANASNNGIEPMSNNIDIDDSHLSCNITGHILTLGIKTQSIKVIKVKIVTKTNNTMLSQVSGRSNNNFQINVQELPIHLFIATDVTALNAEQHFKINQQCQIEKQ
ncbi:hypothetical protein [Vibrio algicola]|uniref:Uncharacterized protein n=1 Tax=Vibrio algicola TaxID=2662262 RepID=A0A5Q0TJ52_9VIBR|nr:hypothetical protein [Vibrio algicola]